MGQKPFTGCQTSPKGGDRRDMGEAAAGPLFETPSRGGVGLTAWLFRVRSGLGTAALGRFNRMSRSLGSILTFELHQHQLTTWTFSSNAPRLVCGFF